MACTLRIEKLAKYFSQWEWNELVQHGDELRNFREDVAALLRRLKTKTISGSISVASLAVAASVKVTVDHSGTGSFCFSELPIFTVVTGIQITPYLMVPISGTTYVTAGGRFCILIDNISSDDGTGYSGAFTLSWTRTGILV